MKVTYVSIFAIVIVLLSGIPLISDDAMNFADARYTNTQTQANANDCNTGTNCAINSPQTQGHGSSSSPTNLQISRFNEEQEKIGEEPNPGAKGFVEVQKIVICPTAGRVLYVQLQAGFCMSNCRQGFVCPTAGSFTMNVDVSGYVTMRNPHTFPGTPSPGIVQVVINLRADGTANYIVTESGALFYFARISP
jgi:hypothetical protein